MFVIGNLLTAVATVLHALFNALLLVILVNALLSWVRPDPNNPIVMFLERVSDLVCEPIRRLFPTNFGGLDVAPFIAMLVIYFVQQFLVGSLRDVAMRMG